MKFQSDNNAVVYDSQKQPIWSTETYGKGDQSGDSKLILQDDGNLMIFDKTNATIWSLGIVFKQ